MHTSHPKEPKQATQLVNTLIVWLEKHINQHSDHPLGALLKQLKKALSVLKQGGKPNLCTKDLPEDVVIQVFKELKISFLG